MRFFWAIPLALSLYVSCTFQPDGDFFNAVQPPSGSNSTVELENQKDPITVAWPTTFNFKIKPDDSGPYQTDVNFDGRLIYSSTSSNGLFSFTIVPGQYSNGEKELKITASHLTNSNSLAGKAGLETLVFSKTFDVIIDNVKPSQMKAPRIALENGKTVVRWDIPDKTTFQRLVVLKHYVVNYVHLAVDTLRPASQGDTFVHDQSYVGGDVRYSVDLIAPGMYLRGDEGSFNCDPITLSFDSQTGQINWTQPLVYGNNIELIVNNVDRVSGSIAGGYHIDVPFGKSAFATITIRPLSPERINPIVYTKTIEAFQGKRCQPFYIAEYLKSDNTFIFSNFDKTSKVDGSTFELISAPNLPGSILMQSTDGNYTYIWNGNFLSNGQGLRRINASNFTIIESLDLRQIVGGFPNLNEKPTITNDNFFVGRIDGTFSTYYVIDLNAKIVLRKSNNPMMVSSDSKHMLRGDSIFAKGTNNWGTFEGKVNISGLSNLTFYQNDLIHRLYGTLNNGTVKVFDLSSQISPSGEFPEIAHNLPPSTSGYKFDYFGSTIYSIENSGDIKLYDLTSFQLKKTVTSVYEPNKVVCVNGSVLHQNGFVLPRTN